MLQGPHAIATGNWGCGAFRGNPQLKSLLQWAAASCAGAPSLHYYTFESPEVRQVRRNYIFSIAKVKHQILVRNSINSLFFLLILDVSIVMLSSPGVFL